MTEKLVPERIERSVSLQAARERVWETLTDPGLLRQWFAAEVEFHPTPGGHARFRPDHGPERRGRVEDVQDGRRLAFTWWPDEREDEATRVEFTLDDEVGGTRLTVVETGFQALTEGPMAALTHDWGWGLLLGDLPRVLALRRHGVLAGIGN